MTDVIRVATRAFITDAAVLEASAVEIILSPQKSRCGKLQRQRRSRPILG